MFLGTPAPLAPLGPPVRSDTSTQKRAKGRSPLAPQDQPDRMGYRGFQAHPVHQEGLVLLDPKEKGDCLGISAYQEKLERSKAPTLPVTFSPMWCLSFPPPPPVMGTRALREVLVGRVPQDKGAGLGYLDLWGLLDLEGRQDRPDHPTVLASVTWKTPMWSVVFKEWLDYQDPRVHLVLLVFREDLDCQGSLVRRETRDQEGGMEPLD